MRYENKTSIQGIVANTDIFSNYFDTNQVVMCSAQLVALGDVLGNFKLQSSDDTIKPINWVDVPNTAIAVNGAGTYAIPKFEISSNFHRLVFIDVSSGMSTGNITCNLFCQGM